MYIYGGSGRVTVTILHGSVGLLKVVHVASVPCVNVHTYLHTYMYLYAWLIKIGEVPRPHGTAYESRTRKTAINFLLTLAHSPLRRKKDVLAGTSFTQYKRCTFSLCFYFPACHACVCVYEWTTNVFTAHTLAVSLFYQRERLHCCIACLFTNYGILLINIIFINVCAYTCVSYCCWYCFVLANADYTSDG